MGRKVNKENLDVCNYLKEKGYKYAVMLKNNLNEVWATKANRLKSTGEFSNNSKWDCFSLTTEDVFCHTPGDMVEL